MPETTDFLFVYGTLRRGGKNPHRERFIQQTEFIAPAWYAGRLYRLGWYPAAVPAESATDRVRGELYRLPAPELLLPLLDEYEECAPSTPQPHEYRRTIQPVTLDDGSVRQAWIYLYHRPLGAAPRILSGDFLAP